MRLAVRERGDFSQMFPTAKGPSDKRPASLWHQPDIAPKPLSLIAGEKRRASSRIINRLRLSHQTLAAKGLLRHASVTTTQKHYIKEVPEVTLKAMKKVEALCTNRATAVANRPN